jgi:hypothetical protein
MNPQARRAHHIRNLKRAGLGWCVLVCIAGMAGGILSLIELENDDA